MQTGRVSYEDGRDSAEASELGAGSWTFVGPFAINQEHLPCTAGNITGEVKNRSISTLITCDENGICSDIPQFGKNK